MWSKRSEKDASISSGGSAPTVLVPSRLTTHGYGETIISHSSAVLSSLITPAADAAIENPSVNIAITKHSDNTT